MTKLLLRFIPFVLGLAGVLLLLRGPAVGPSREGASSPDPMAAAEEAHRAAGVPIRADPAVAGAFQQRVHVLERRLAASPGDRASMLELARLLHDGHRPDEAVPHYRGALELDPTDAQTAHDLADALAQGGDWEGAEAVLRERIEREPGDAQALYNLGAVRANRGDTAGARSWWARALESAGDSLRATVEASLARLEGGVPR
jgi:Flp pilus assembly protein TadD